MKIRQQGLTLIELMIVVVVLAILATIAYPSYQHVIRQTRLANVRTELVQNANQLERYYTQRGTFVDANTGENAITLAQNDFFTISFNGAPTASGYILQAAPNANNSGETCTVFLNDSGIFWASSSAANTSCPGYETPVSAN